MHSRSVPRDSRAPLSFSDRPTLFGPRLSCALSGCALAAVSHYLGASWLSEPWLGLPVGAWLVGAATGITHFLASRREYSFSVAPMEEAAAEPMKEAARGATRERVGTPRPWNSVRESAERSAPRAAMRTSTSPRATMNRPEPSSATGPAMGEVSIVGVGWPADASSSPPVANATNRTARETIEPKRAATAEATTDDEVNVVNIEAIEPPAPRRANRGLAALWPAGALRLGRRLMENPQDAIRNARSIVAPSNAQPGPSRLRIGVYASAREMDTLIDLAMSEPASGTRVEWIPIAHPRDAYDPAALRLDAVISRGRHDELTIRVPEDADHPAGWANWTTRLPLGYAGVFPTRIDTAYITCGVLDLVNERDARLVARLAEAAGLLGRIDSRLSPRAMDGRWPIRDLILPGGALERTMLRLSHVLAADWTRHPARSVTGARAAARAASAWLASWDDIDSKERRRLVEACAEILGDEPESMLRVAAARLAAYEDDSGLHALSKGFKLLITQREPVVADPLAFVHAEIEFGSPSVLTLGRAASGLCLLWATSNQESLDYLRDDLLEDLRFASRFVGHDQDHLLLREVIRHMDQLRSEMLPLPGVAA